MIQEFGISITAVGGDQYLIRTEKVSKGVQHAEEKVHWPMRDWLEEAKSLMHDPLLGLLKGDPPGTIPATRAGILSASRRGTLEAEAEAATLVHLGRTLHDELFKGQLHDSWVTAQGVAQNRQDFLRLRIGMKDGRLQQLPWEALHAGTRPLAAGTDVIFSRYILDRRQQHSISLAKSSESGQVLRILVVIASPDDQERLALTQEVKHLRVELHPENADPEDTLVDIQLTILEQPGRAELTQELERGKYQVLHYAGHSNLGASGGDLYLVSRQTGLTERLSGEDLAGLLVNNGIKLAVFNSCRGSFSSAAEDGWQERNLAQALVNRGVPGVIAMTERIPDHVAITFTQLLYRNLKKGQSIDLSLNRTRQGLISAYGSHQFYWALPTLYMNPFFDGYLVRAIGDLENANALDIANDPYGDLFLDPTLADIDLPNRRLKRPLPVERTPHKEQPQAPSKKTDKTLKKTRADMLHRDSAEDSKAANPQNVVEPEDATTSTPAEEGTPTPHTPVEVDGELRVPEELETPSSFYGDSEASGVPLEEIVVDNPTVPDGPLHSAGPEEMVGERLPRSHTLHTKLLTTPGIISIALISILGFTTVQWLKHGPLSASSQTVVPTEPSNTTNANNADSIGLPGQIEIALNQNRLDKAVLATQELLDGGEFEKAVTALETASPQQQEDAVIALLKGRAQWGLAKQGNPNFSAEDARRSWEAALASESDWMEIAMALGFAHHAVGREQLAMETWEQAINLATRQPDADNAYFSEKTANEYALNAYAGIAMSALSLSKVEVDSAERNRLVNKAEAAYRKVLDEAPTDFSAKALGSNWLWLSPAIDEWNKAKQELSQLAL